MKVALVQFSPLFKKPRENRETVNGLVAHLSPESVDLLVLPELAFSGYVFKDRDDIKDFIEHPETGDSVVWAKQKAKELEAWVQIGFPRLALEDPEKWYNSVCIISPDGEVMAIYDKHFLYETDESWAEPGIGFKVFDVDGLKYGPGICMDINPFQFTAPFEKFEFGNFHKDAGSSVIAISMAWLSSRDMNGKDSTVPSMDTMNYWATRLSPLWNANYPILVICCNRIGTENGKFRPILYFW
ncbi:Carbon-nitrogen hydrolase [Nowakowskiella sp. JEL0407]|nr:Carbon-nitrogen hydrolase [Nowakowskiella sp. JEL0407]